MTGLTNGTAYTFTVTATNSVGASAASTASNSVTPTAPITVIPDPTIYVTGVRLNLTTQAGKVGDAAVRLIATITPRYATYKDVTWSTSDPLVATVNYYGLVNFIGSGTATITVTTSDGTYTAECEVTVSTATGTEDVPQSAKLYAVPTSDSLQLYGLVPDEVFSIYNMSGRLQFSGKATATEQLVPLREHGVYIVASGNRNVKTMC